MNKAVNFEYEWMADGTLRVRFLDRDDTILSQQLIAVEGLVPLQTLVAIAVAKLTRIDARLLRVMFGTAGANLNLSQVELLRDSVRLRVGLTLDGNIDVHTLKDE